MRRICLALYLIEILHQTTTHAPLRLSPLALYLIEILHQTTTSLILLLMLLGCILSKFYIKPQHSLDRFFVFCVVSYRNSTSNHNYYEQALNMKKLYLIEILHQTTTSTQSESEKKGLYLIEILHQTTTMRRVIAASCGCILSKFYIKPQLPGDTLDFSYVVSYRNSTSNHNNPRYLPNRKNVVSYRNSTSNHN